MCSYVSDLLRQFLWLEGNILLLSLPAFGTVLRSWLSPGMSRQSLPCPMMKKGRWRKAPQLGLMCYSPLLTFLRLNCISGHMISDLQSLSKFQHSILTPIGRATSLMPHYATKIFTSQQHNTASTCATTPLISNSSPSASRAATCAFVHGAASWWRKWWCCPGCIHCQSCFMCFQGCHARLWIELPNASTTTSSTTLAPLGIAI